MIKYCGTCTKTLEDDGKYPVLKVICNDCADKRDTRTNHSEVDVQEQIKKDLNKYGRKVNNSRK